MITSPQNPLIKSLLKLNTRKNRLLQGLFLIEGEREILHAQNSGYILNTFLYCPDLLAANRQLNTPAAIENLLRHDRQRRIEMVPVNQRVFALGLNVSHHW